MSAITVLFTKRPLNPLSWLIRWAVPRSRFSLALSSHAMVIVGNDCYEAGMLTGVRVQPIQKALRGQEEVKRIVYQVPDAAAGVAWLDQQVGKPYDWRGALALAIKPGRDWAEDDCWFCYELAAGALKAAGRPVFANLSHIGETALMAINP